MERLLHNPISSLGSYSRWRLIKALRYLKDAFRYSPSPFQWLSTVPHNILLEVDKHMSAVLADNYIIVDNRINRVKMIKIREGYTEECMYTVYVL